MGLPPWSDKLVGEVVRLLLDAFYEPTFSDLSHGFRPGRGCHTALRDVADTWTGTTWFIEGDVADCFGSFDHQIMLSTLGETIHDGRFLRLVRNMLTAGYLEDWVWNATLSGVPQGGVVSPVLSNIYLHRLDAFVETVLIPEYTRGRVRKQDTAYARVRAARDRAYRRGDHAQARELRQQLRTMPSGDPRDPGYRRLRYVRYCELCRRRHNVHLLRDLQDTVETYPEAIWPVPLTRSLQGLVHQANLARAAGLREVPPELRDPLIAEYRGAVRVGLADVPPADKGRKQPVGRCLLECLRDRQQDVLRFVFDLDVWPTNNQSERDLRPFKTQQKISGRLTSAAATACRLQIARKHGVSALHALRLAFRGSPWMPPAAVVPT